MTTKIFDAQEYPIKRSSYLWLLILPFGWQVALIPFVNDIDLNILNIPFPMLWQMLGIVFASIIIAIVYRLDRFAGLEAEEAEFLANTNASSTEGAHR